MSRRPNVELRLLRLGRELPRDPDQCLDTTEVEAIRAALERYDGLTADLAAPGEEPPAADQLRQRVDYLWLAFEAADYEILRRALSAVLRDSQRSHTALREAASAQVLAETYQITASTARKLGEFDLAWIAGDRGLAVAEEAADPLLTATGPYRVANALLAMGRVDAAYALNVSCGVPAIDPGYAWPAAVQVSRVTDPGRREVAPARRGPAPSPGWVRAPDTSKVRAGYMAGPVQADAGDIAGPCQVHGGWLDAASVPSAR